MGVEQVYVPPRTGNSNSGTPGPDPNTNEYWKRKAEEARNRRDYLEEQRALDALNQRPLEQPKAPESPIKMSGEISLGKIDFTEQARVAQEELRSQNAAANQRAAQLEQERDLARQETERAKEALLAQTITSMQANLGSQIAELTKQMADPSKKITQRSFAEQLKEITDMTATLGYVRPESVNNKTPAAVVNGTDAAIQLEILRMNLDEKNKERQFQWAMQQDNRKWQLELKKLDLENNFRRAEMDEKKTRGEMLWKAPQILGDSIAKGLAAQRRAPARAPAGRPYAPPIEQEPEPDSTNFDGEVEAAPGATGSLDCPNCKETIVIGPTAEAAVCASCGYRVHVARK